MRTAALQGAESIKPGLDDQSVRKLIYRLGRDTFFDAIAIAAAGQTISQHEYDHFAAAAEAWRPPAFPFSGKDVVAYGIAPGPEIAKILQAAEEGWIAEDFPGEPRRRAILAKIIEER